MLIFFFNLRLSLCLFPCLFREIESRTRGIPKPYIYLDFYQINMFLYLFHGIKYAKKEIDFIDISRLTQA